MQLLFTTARDQDADLQALLALKSSPSDIVWSGYDAPPEIASFRHWYQQQIPRTDRTIYLVRNAAMREQAVGYLYLDRYDENKLRVLSVGHGVAEAEQGKGIGTQIVNFAANMFINHFRDRDELHAWILPSNVASIKTFLSNGFRVSSDSRRVRHHANPDELIQNKYVFSYSR